MNRIDHIVIAASSLQQGVDYIHAVFGVELPRGGFHQTMATHNCLMRLGGEIYLELIAIDPEGETPPHPRWFGLDQALMRERLKRQPRLITWVINTPDIRRLAADAGFDIGTPTALSRDELRWEFALPDDGRLLADGLLPYCIQWHSSPHPSGNMADLGCRLERLTLHHNRVDWLRGRLAGLGVEQLVEIQPIDDSTAPYLSADIATPAKGIVTLSSKF